MWPEIFLIFVFILINGFFAGSEIAVVSARKTRIRELAEQGHPKALLLEQLKKEPDRFLATVQIGVTLVGALASAVGGAAAVQKLKPLLLKIPAPWFEHLAEPVALSIVVLLITFFSLVLGELAPKSLAIRAPEKVALAVSPIIGALSRIASHIVSFLTACTNLILKPFGVPAVGSYHHYSEEEVKQIIQEGTEHGIFEEAEQRLIHSAFEFADISAREVLVPATQMVAIEIGTPVSEILKLVTEEHYSRYPVYEKDVNNIRGILYQKDFLTELAKKREREPNIRELLRKAYFVPDSIKISQVLRVMQRGRTHIAIVMNEYGGVAGLVTIEDLIEELVGEIKDEYDDESPVQRARGGALVADAQISIRDLKEDHNIDLPVSEDYETLGGLILSGLQKIPHGGETIEAANYRLTIVDMDGKRVAKVKIEEIQTPANQTKGD